MVRRTSMLLAALAACVAAPSTATAADPPTVLWGGDDDTGPLPDKAVIVMTEWGYRYVAGQQDTHLTISYADGVLTYADTGTAELKSLPRACAEVEVTTGIAATCPVPAKFADGMYLQVWPRLGDDLVDGSTLPAQFRLWVLADAGVDTMHGGAGDDFFNGAKDADTAYGGAGADWLRAGPAGDRLWGGPGKDRLVGVEGRDQVHGDAGDDRVEGGPGHDRLWGGPGRDVLSCRGGHDAAYAEPADRLLGCEQVSPDEAPSQ